MYVERTTRGAESRIPNKGKEERERLEYPVVIARQLAQGNEIIPFHSPHLHSPHHLLLFQLLSLVLLDASHSRTLLSKADTSFFTSPWVCLLLCSAPLVASLGLALLHALALYAEQVLHALWLQAYMVVVSSPALIRLGFLVAWMLPFALAFPLLPVLLAFFDGERDISFCYLPVVWTAEFSSSLVVFVGIVVVAMTFLCVRFRFRSRISRRPAAGDSSSASAPLVGGKSASSAYRNSANARWTQPSAVSSKKPAKRPPAKTAIVMLSSSTATSSSSADGAVTFAQIEEANRKASFINFLVVLLLHLPAIAHNSLSLTEGDIRADLAAFLASDEDEVILKRAEADQRLAWTCLLVLLSGAFTPVLHLLTDDVISGLGLELFRSLGRKRPSGSGCFWRNKRRRVPREHFKRGPNNGGGGGGIGRESGANCCHFKSPSGFENEGFVENM